MDHGTGSSETEREIQNILEAAPDSTNEAFVCVVAAGNNGWDPNNAEVINDYDSHASKASHAHGIGNASIDINVPSVNSQSVDSLEVFYLSVWIEAATVFTSVRLKSPSDSTYWVYTWNSHATICGDPSSYPYYADPDFGAYCIYNEIWQIDPSIKDPFPNRTSEHCEIWVADFVEGGLNFQMPSGTWQFEIDTDAEWDLYISSSEMYGSPECAQIADSDYDPNYTLEEPSCTPDVITVASVNSKNHWTDCLTTQIPTTTSQFDSAGYQLGDISFFSSQGPSRLSTQNPPKPESYAPGAWIASTKHSYISQVISWMKAEDCQHVYSTGTSFSAPHVAGAIALALDLNPDLTAEQIRTLVTNLPTVDGHCFNTIDFLHQIDPICMAGDVNADGAVDMDDIVYLIDYLFAGGPVPIPEVCCGRVEGTDDPYMLDIADIVYLIQYLYAGGPEPVPGCHYVP